MIGRNTKTGDGVFSNLQRPLSKIHLAKVRMAGTLVTQSSLESPGVSLGALVARWPTLTATPSQGDRLGRPDAWACYSCGRSCEGAGRSIWPPQGRLGIHLRFLHQISGLILSFLPKSPFDKCISRAPLTSRTRLKYFARASLHWWSFSSRPQVTGRKKNFVRDY